MRRSGRVRRAASEKALRIPAPTGNRTFGSAGLGASGPSGSTAR